MTFRKDSLFFYEFEIGIMVMLIVPIIVACEIRFWPLLVFSLLFYLIPIVYPFFQNEYITINEFGIQCNNIKTKKVLWDCKWSEISMLRRCSMYRWPAVNVVIYDKDGKPEKFNGGRNFLLCKTAKKALNMYAGDLWVDR